MSPNSGNESGEQTGQRSIHSDDNDVVVDNDRPPSLLQAFYAQHGVHLMENNNKSHDPILLLEAPPHRFVRLNPRHDKKNTLEELQAEISAFLQVDNGNTNNNKNHDYPLAVPWLDELFGFYAVPRDFSLSQSACFNKGKIYGQDVSSGAAVAALLTNQYDKKISLDSSSSRSSNDRQQHHDEEEKMGGLECCSSSSWRVLDLCCSPGLKLCAMADWLSSNRAITDDAQRQQQQQPIPTMLVGVDVSESRMAVCTRVVRKYHIDPETCGDETYQSPNHIQLYCNDGTKFGGGGGGQEQDEVEEELNLIFDSIVAREQAAHNKGQRKRMNKSARARERKRLKQIMTMPECPQEPFPSIEDNDTTATTTTTTTTTPASVVDTRLVDASPSNDADASRLRGIGLFDRVLVDAECSTDGSLKHVQKRFRKQQGDILDIPQLTDQQQLLALVDLQKRLAASGFRLTRPGGYMVYSTCSLSEDQNEGVVEWLLQEFKDAVLVPLDFGQRDSSCINPHQTRLNQSGRLPGTVRFLPLASSNTENSGLSRDNDLYGEGFFLAKIFKKREI